MGGRPAALVPGVAGMSGMHHRPFTIANAIGGATWATLGAVAGYLAGRRTGGGDAVRASEVVIAVVVVVLLVRHFRRESSETADP